MVVMMVLAMKMMTMMIAMKMMVVMVAIVMVRMENTHWLAVSLL